VFGAYFVKTGTDASHAWLRGWLTDSTTIFVAAAGATSPTAAAGCTQSTILRDVCRFENLKDEVAGLLLTRRARGYSKTEWSWKRAGASAEKPGE
jgi:hypothetical protein